MAELPENDRLTGPFIATNGQTVFPADFPLIDAPGDAPGSCVVFVRVREGVRTELALGDFAVSEGTDSGFNLTLTTGAQTGDRCFIVGRQRQKRLREHALNGAIRTPTLEGDARDLAARSQEARRDLDRAVAAPLGEQGLELEPAAARRGKLAWFMDTATAPFGTLSQDDAAQMFKGDPGGSAMAVGLFTAIGGLNIPAGTDLVQTSGHTIKGTGAARYKVSLPGDHDGIETPARRVSANDRMVELAEAMVFVTMTGALPDAVATVTATTTVDGVDLPSAYSVTGTDNTDAINAALALGPAWLDRGDFRVQGQLWCEIDGGGLRGMGSGASRLIADQTMDRFIGVLVGTLGTQWTGFSMLGPYSFGDAVGPLNRALTVGLQADRTTTAAGFWDASGTWIDDLKIAGFCTGVHLSRADNVKIGLLEVRDLGDAAAEPGSYGVQCSGRNLRAHRIEVDGGVSLGRHAVYISTQATNCWVDFLSAKRFGLNPWQTRIEEGGGNRCGFTFGEFERCHVAPGGDEAGVAYWGTIGDATVTTATGCGWGKMVLRNCGGKQVAMRNMIRPECGEVVIEDHTGLFAATGGKYLVELYNCTEPRLPQIKAVKGFTATAWPGDPAHQAQMVPLRLENVTYPTGGSLEFDGESSYPISGQNVTGGEMDRVVLNGTKAVTTSFPAGANLNNCFGFRIRHIIAKGTWAAAIRYAGSTDNCGVDRVTPVTEPLTALFLDGTTSGNILNDTMRAPGYDVLVVTADSPRVDGYRTLRIAFAVAGNLTTLLGGHRTQRLRLKFSNALATLVHDVGKIKLNTGANRTTNTRDATDLAQDDASGRWLEAA